MGDPGAIPQTGIEIIYWVITGLLVPCVIYLYAQTRALQKEKEVRIAELTDLRIEDLKHGIDQYHDALKVVESSFDLAKNQSAGFDAFKEKVTAFISKSENFQDRMMEILVNHK